MEGFGLFKAQEKLIWSCKIKINLENPWPGVESAYHVTNGGTKTTVLPMYQRGSTRQESTNDLLGHFATAWSIAILEWDITYHTIILNYMSIFFKYISKSWYIQLIYKSWYVQTLTLSTMKSMESAICESISFLGNRPIIIFLSNVAGSIQNLWSTPEIK